ncbi:hypothetical protein RHCH11_RHCH11_00787 [Beijerinckiaceae bacterium RH CH11]|nr:hypothetical protein RHAL8_00786 [Beijerinckiaceae bacterium RH AL8]VVB43624.1 hypothetical protein RHCH11_RHCH11_00787 [Beijerinckiaceae bacterium RH CH11]
MSPSAAVTVSPVVVPAAAPSATLFAMPSASVGVGGATSVTEIATFMLVDSAGVPPSVAVTTTL